MIPALIGMAGGLLSSAMNSASVAQTNAQNEALQRDQWQRDDTAYQRMVSDMQAAGLNPLSQFSSPQSSPLSSQIQPNNFDSLASSLGNAAALQVEAEIKQKQFDLQNKGINLAAISKGINPKKLDAISDDDSILAAYETLIQSEAKDWKKNADAPGTKYDNVWTRLYKDAKNEFPALGQLADNAARNGLSFLEFINEVKAKGGEQWNKFQDWLKKKFFD